jgi:hypothetical protein
MLVRIVSCRTTTLLIEGVFIPYNAIIGIGIGHYA